MNQTKWATQCFYILLIGFLTGAVEIGINFSTLMFYVRSFGGTVATFSWMLAGFGGLLFISSPMWGSLSDRFGRKPVLLFLCFGSILANCLLVFANSLGEVVTARLLTGLFGASNVILVTMAVDYQKAGSPSRFAKISWVEAALTFGGLIVGPLVGGIAAQYDLRSPYYLCLTVAVVRFCIVLILMKESSPASKKFKLNWKQCFGDFDLLANTSNLKKVAILSAFLGLGVVAREVSVAYFLKDRAELTTADIGMFQSLQGWVMVLVQIFLIGILSQKFSQFKLLVFAGLSISLGSTILISSPNPLLIGLHYVLFGFGFAFMFPILGTMASESTSDENRGASISIMRSGFNFGRIAAPIFGYSYDKISIFTPICFSLVFFAFIPSLSAWWNSIDMTKNQ